MEHSLWTVLHSPQYCSNVQEIRYRVPLVEKITENAVPTEFFFMFFLNKDEMLKQVTELLLMEKSVI